MPSYSPYVRAYSFHLTLRHTTAAIAEAMGNHETVAIRQHTLLRPGRRGIGGEAAVQEDRRLLLPVAPDVGV
jgi:hypothetical protein